MNCANNAAHRRLPSVAEELDRLGSGGARLAS
jgi:hypothetical protein